MAAPTSIGALPEHKQTELLDAGSRRRDRLRRQKTVIVFDWDSTIMPTGHLFECGYITIRGKAEPKAGLNLVHALQIYDHHAVSALERLYQMCNGKIILLSNTTRDWVDQTAKKYLPRVYRWILGKKIAVTSLYDRYGEMLYTQPIEKKESALLDIIYRYFPNRSDSLDFTLVYISGLISELKPVQNVKKNYIGNPCKLFKLRERPTVVECFYQLLVVADRMPQLLIEKKKEVFRWDQEW